LKTNKHLQIKCIPPSNGGQALSFFPQKFFPLLVFTNLIMKRATTIRRRYWCFSPSLGVSRMIRMDSSYQCYTKDGSRPTAYAVQTVFANHLKVLCSKGMVLNIQVKILYKQYQVRVKKLNIIEPLMKCRNGSSYCKS
jgi:hypothetical protein